MNTLLGASYRTGLVGVALIALSVVLFALGRIAEGVTTFTIGVGFLNARDSSVTSTEQALNPGSVAKAPDLTVTEKLAPTVNQIVRARIQEIVAPQIQALDKTKVDK